MRPDIDEALRYLGAGGGADEALRARAEEIAGRLAAAVTPRTVYRVFDLVREEGGFRLAGTEVRLTGRSAELMLRTCTRAALLGCTLGAEFDGMLRREQVRDMADAVVLDACGSAWVEASCDSAEGALAARLPGQYLTDRFSPGYGDLPLELQPAILAALDAPRRIGLHVTPSLMLDPVKSVTAVIGIGDTPQPARIRGCGFCSMRETCTLRRGGQRCEL